MAAETLDIKDELNMPAVQAARRLLGSLLEVDILGQRLRFRIVETEAYDQTDEASHSFKGMTERTRVMFGPAGKLYVYFIYGMYHCANIVVGADGYGAAVLLRALEPLGSTEEMLWKIYPLKRGCKLTNGPARLCTALGIDKRLNGHDLAHSPLLLTLLPPVVGGEIVRAPRIGISKAADKLWRFYIKDSPYVSVMKKKGVFAKRSGKVL